MVSITTKIGQIYDHIVEQVPYGAGGSIYNYALTANQIKNLYTGGSAVRFGPGKRATII